MALCSADFFHDVVVMNPSLPPEQSPSAKRRPRRWLGWLRDGLILLVLLAAVQWWQSRDLVRETAPPLVGLSTEGTPVSLSGMSRPVLVYFWAEWCPVCRFAEDGIDRLAGRYPVVTVATSSGDREAVAGYMASEGLTMRVIVDEHGEIARRWGVYGVPASFIIDADGEIRHASRGYSSEYGLWLRLWWTKWLG
jgi:peroxiredoxin